MTFNDTKEGAFGIRVARELDHASKQATRLVGSDGKPEAKPRVDNSKTTGQYLASDGTEGEAVWGTRGPWMALRGTVDGEPLTVAILDHPSNHGHPTYWHARGYGLFAANPFGRQGYDPKQPPVTFTLEPSASLTFRQRILVLNGQPGREALQKAFDEFAAEKAPSASVKSGKGDSPLTRGLQSDVADIPSLTQRAIDYARRGDFGTDARALNEELTRLAPDNEGAWTRLARCCLEAGQLGDASSALESALLLNPQNNLARSLLQEVIRRELLAETPEEVEPPKKKRRKAANS